MNDIEIAKATYLDDIFIIPQDEAIYRVDHNGRRYYVKLGEDNKPVIRPSVTSVISKYHPTSPWLLKWLVEKGEEDARAIQDETSIYGTLCHIIWAKLLLKYKIGLDDFFLKNEIQELFDKENKQFIYNYDEWIFKLRQDIIGFIQWVQDYKIKPIFIEMTIFGETHSGTIDLGCQATFKIYNRSTKEYDVITKNILVDWKSGRKDFYDSNIVQLEGYWDLVKEKIKTMPNIYPFEEIWNYGCNDFRIPIGKTVTPYRFQNQTASILRKRWSHYLQMYIDEEPEVALSSRTEIKQEPVTINTQIADCFETINPLDFLEVENAGNNTGQ